MTATKANRPAGLNKKAAKALWHSDPLPGMTLQRPPAAAWGAAERRLAAWKGSAASGSGPNRRYALVAPRYYGRQFTSSATCSPFSDGKGS
jgi:hypothetical protein